MADLHTTFTPALADLDDRHLRRRRRVVAAGEGATLVVDGQPLLAFAGNDYLGLAHHPALRGAAAEAAALGAGATASALIAGQSPAHAALEADLAAFVGADAALLFHSGYAANTGVIPALVGPTDAVFSDALNHASLIDGVRLSGASRHVVPHQDLRALDAALAAASGARRRLVVCDAVYSMDGDVAPLPDLLTLCERHDAWLMVDDAHGFGVLGDRGAGTVEHFGVAGHPRLVHMATLGKAAGVAGAFVVGPRSLVEWLANRARTYVFATALPPMVVQSLRAALRLIDGEPQRRRHLQALIARFRAGAGGLPWPLLPSATAIQPLVVGGNAEVLALDAALRARGLWVPAIRPPTVPVGSARLRVSLSAAHTEADVDRLCAALRALAVSGILDG
ncbi:8-amino-7-oxononanoate synthase [Aquabacterium sp. J223]|uniref:8-amino-7-oxononanoate synthase n=1 Tax=Aquabacterium sp. J223 TaxID=2898431 RepID=UPI0021ADE680|nr:8-amino-7-oxononanoate synthase [Aquabacterium sp. J223]UUX95750.1 8-amino-7-oxononanoate synthase [Aquabacterium sp. J223]